MRSIEIVARLDKVVAQGSKATVTLVMGEEMAYLAPKLAELAGETVIASIAAYQDALPMDGMDG
jgi:hypothetical protein